MFVYGEESPPLRYMEDCHSQGMRLRLCVCVCVCVNE